jgi:choline dehydrogenase-like flavoprotein
LDLDARALDNGTMLAADVCVIGAGPVGLTLADALRARGRTVVLVESGDDPASAEHDDLNRGEVHGALGPPLHATRARGVGGTANIWNTTAHNAVYAKLAPLDACDYPVRDWVDFSGWPFDAQELEPWYACAHDALGVGPFDFRDTRWRDTAHPSLDGSGGLFTSAAFQCVPSTRFTVELPKVLRDAATVTLLRGATVTALQRGRDGAVESVQWQSIRGTSGVVRAGSFVLALGGIDNARMLLVDARQRGDTSVEAGWLGRGFMGHPRDVTVELFTRAPALTIVPGFYTPHRSPDGVVVAGRLAVSSNVLQQLQTSNASVQLVNEDDAQRMAMEERQARWRSIPLRAVRKATRVVAPRVTHARQVLMGHHYQVIINLEERPHRDNRVVLTDDVDRFGMPRVALHTRWHDDDERSRVVIRRAVVDELTRLGLGRVRVTPNRPLDPDAHHHSGTTRMHPDPHLGVVDADCRVHGERNLHVAGSSVFPTAGWANPTLTAIALGLRLADRLA